MNGRVRHLAVAFSLLVAGSAAAAGPSDGSCADTVASPVAALAEVMKPILPRCQALPASKTYPKGQTGRTWYGAKKIEVQCDYTCTSENFPTMTLTGTRTVTFLSEAGYELSCYGIRYEQRYNNYKAAFVYLPMETTWFNPAKSDVKELEGWVAGKPWGR